MTAVTRKVTPLREQEGIPKEISLLICSYFTYLLTSPTEMREDYALVVFQSVHGKDICAGPCPQLINLPAPA